MGRAKIVGVSGSPQRPSRTTALVEAIAGEVARRHPADVAVLDLVGLGGALGAARSARELTGDAAAAVAAIEEADLLVVASPVYKGSYAGLFKHLFDLVDPNALAGRPVVVGATGGSERHSLVIDHALKPLFGFFGALVAPTGVYAVESDFTDGRPGNPAVLQRVADAGRQGALLLHALRDAAQRAAA